MKAEPVHSYKRLSNRIIKKGAAAHRLKCAHGENVKTGCIALVHGETYTD